ncbi:MAG TPA: SDR family oxidoreductase [Candidatus Binatia bacterium]|nr:SDR family oxidoreductase [Candidatus Binatia bacterium]
MSGGARETTGVSDRAGDRETAGAEGRETAGAEGREILVIGASGLVGQLMMERFGQRAAGTYATHDMPGLVQLDITDAEATRRVIDELAPRVIVHTAALTDVNMCERDPAASDRVNVAGTRNVAEAAAEVGARYIFFSTDYVFGDDGPHDVDRLRMPMNVYGAHKAEAEDVVAELDDHVILRACNVYGYQREGKNFAMGIFESLLQGRRVLVAVDQWGSPTLASDLVDVAALLVDSDVRGPVHVAGPDQVTRLEWARRVAEVNGLDVSLLEPVPYSALGASAPRPRRGGLFARRTEEMLDIRFKRLDEGLMAMRAALEEAGVLPRAAPRKSI